jgi:hypothetical protein
MLTEHLRNRVEDEANRKSPLVWIDTKREYEEVVSQWKESDNELRYPIYAFGGSFLELMLAAREPLSRKSSAPCVIYLPGFEEGALKDTPIYEAATAGKTWSVSLERIVRESGEGLLRSDQIDYILSRENLTAKEAEKLAEGMTSRPPELEHALAEYGEDGIVVSFLEGTLDSMVELAVLKEHFDRVFGCTEEWMKDWAGEDATEREIAWALGAYLLCLEYACDLAVEPPSARLKGLANKDREYRARAARTLRIIRIEKPNLYKSLVEKTELDLEEAERTVSPEGLGNLDTFRFESNIILDAALAALRTSEWNRALAFAEPRLSEEAPGESSRTFWLKQEPARELIWKWIEVTARLGREIRNSGEAMPASFRAIYETYVSGEWKIDRYHREYRILTNSITTQTFFRNIGDYFSIRNTMNRLYRSWADGRSRAWNTLCVKERFAVPEGLSQRGFFGRSVAPLLQGKRKTALILVDALRYELGEELARMLADYANGQKILSPMLAELPTITAVGMNALMPVEQEGTLDPVFDKTGKKLLGFRSGERQITDPVSRQKALNDFADGRCEWTDLGGFLDAAEKNLKRLVAANLLVISTQDIDAQGESGSSDFGIDFFQPVLARIREAVDKLRSQGFDRILITADHGFLIGDETVENALGSRIEGAERRHAFDMLRSGERLASVTLTDLSWKTEDREKALVFETGTHLLTSAKARTFYHGGNSPQERVIPLITLSGGAPVQARDERYQLKMKALPSVFGTSRVSVSVECAEAGELFAPDRVELRLSPESGFRLTIGDAEGMRFSGDTFECPVGKPTTITFKITSPAGGKSRLFANQVSSLVFVDPAETVEYFDVEQTETAASAYETAAEHTVQPVASGMDSSERFSFPREHIPAEYETAIMHLVNHGKLSEGFLRNSLGNNPAASRKARQFAIRIEEWKCYLPFSVTVHQTTDGNEYRKQ